MEHLIRKKIMKNKKIKIISILIAFLLVTSYSLTSFADLTELDKQAADLNHDGKINQQDLELIVHQPFPEHAKDGVKASGGNARYIFKDNLTSAEIDDFAVDITKSRPSFVIKKEDVLRKAIESLYSGEEKENLLSVLDDGTFMRLQNEYNVNAVFAIAVCKHETECGTYWSWIKRTTNNWMGLPGDKSYSNFSEATIDFGREITSGSYMQNGEYSVKQIGPKYDSDDWAEDIIDTMKEIYRAAGINLKTRLAGGGSILQAADEIHQDEITWTYAEPYSLLVYNDIEAQLNNPNMVTCCATFVSEALYLAGLFSVDEMNSFGYNSAPGLHDFLVSKGWQEIKSYNDMQPGDVVFIFNENAYGHVQLYAGDGTWYNAGSTSSIQRPSPYGADCSGGFTCAMRP